MVERKDFDSEADYQSFLAEAEHRFKSLGSGVGATSIRLSLRKEIFDNVTRLQEQRKNEQPAKYAEQVKEHMIDNQKKKQEAVQTANDPQLTTAEKLRMLRGLPINRAQAPVRPNIQATNQEQNAPVSQTNRGFDVAMYKRIEALRNKLRH